MARIAHPRAHAGASVPVRRGFPAAMIMMLLPVIIGALASMMNSWGGFIEAAFMDMTLTLERFDYGFGPSACGGWHECGNATFDSYRSARDLSFGLFVIALIAVAVKDMLKGAFDAEAPSLGESDNKTLPEMLKYSVMVFMVLFVFPPIWDASAGAMNNVGVWILNPHYDLIGKQGQYEHGSTGNMCVGDLSYDQIAELAPYARSWDRWAVYRDHGAAGPMKGGQASQYHEADNYVVQKGDSLTTDCLNEGIGCPKLGTLHGGVAAGATGPGDVLCNPDYRVKYIFRQAIGVTETTTVGSPEQVLGAVSGTGGNDFMVNVLTQFIKGSVTLQVIMIVFMTGVMVDVVTAFALAIIPIVPFYRFLPFSSKVQLGDYSGAAFALLAMPLVASLIVVAGAAAVSTMAADEAGDDFETFFAWLAALSVVLLVIGIPATMVPLIGAGVGQATAAVQTGVQTAQFAGTAVAASAGGAIRSARGSGEYAKLRGMDPSKMSAEQKTRMNQLGKQGLGGEHGRLSSMSNRTPEQQARLNQLNQSGGGGVSRAQAALGGGMSGMRSQMYGKDGTPTEAFTRVVSPGAATKDLMGKAMDGFTGFEATGSGAGKAAAAGGLAGTIIGSGKGVADGVMSEVKSGRAPTKEEMLAEAKKQQGEAEAEREKAQGNEAKAKKEMTTATTAYAPANEMRKAEKLRGLETRHAAGAEEGIKKLNNQKQAVAAKLEDAEHTRHSMREAMVNEAENAKAEKLAEMGRNNEGMVDLNNKRAAISASLTGAETARMAAERSYGKSKAADENSPATRMAKAKLDQMQASVDGLRAEHDAILDEIRTADGSKVKEMQDNFESLTNDGIAKQDERIKELNTKIDEIDAGIETRTAEMQRAERAVERHKTDAEERYRNAVDEARKEREKHGEKFEAAVKEAKKKLLDDPDAFGGGMNAAMAGAVLDHHAAQDAMMDARKGVESAEARVDGMQKEVESEPEVKQDKKNTAPQQKGEKDGKWGSGRRRPH